jgi:hypothetical protein
VRHMSADAALRLTLLGFDLYDRSAAKIIGQELILEPNVRV